MINFLPQGKDFIKNQIKTAPLVKYSRFKKKLIKLRIRRSGSLPIPSISLCRCFITGSKYHDFFKAEKNIVA